MNEFISSLTVIPVSDPEDYCPNYDEKMEQYCRERVQNSPVEKILSKYREEKV